MGLRGFGIIVGTRLGSVDRSLSPRVVGSTVRRGLVVLVGVGPLLGSCTFGWEEGSSEEGCCTFQPSGSKGCRPDFGSALAGSWVGSCLDILTSDCQQVVQFLQEVGSYNHRSILDTAVGVGTVAVAFREGWRVEAVVVAFCRNLQESLAGRLPDLHCSFITEHRLSRSEWERNY